MTSTLHPSEPALDLSDVVVTFGHKTALDGLTLSALPGQITAVLGPNGAGKTTMIRCCTGLVRPDSGQIRVLGEIPGSTEAASRIGLMPQSTGAWSGIKADELLRYLAGLYANPQPVDELIDLLGIGDFARTPYRRLSGGQQQSVNLAGALVGRPELVFLDEPTAGMDPHVRRHTWSVIQKLRDDGVAVLLTTHAMDEAAGLADQVWMVDRGRVVVSGTVAELTREDSLEDVFLANTTARVGGER
ncbi:MULTISPECIES: ABC transporter ATP-binding protein [unclassified Luteococcus]|uniref:ABC transporter ATP-binding protein n=1 Tax=unclassified Luteococcus TaxID=2639923 RepID=UPI00313BE08F